MLAKLITSVSALVCVGVSASNAASQISRPREGRSNGWRNSWPKFVPLTGNSRAGRVQIDVEFSPSFHPECRIVVVGKLHSDTTVYYQTSEKPILKTMAASQAEGKDFGIGDLRPYFLGQQYNPSHLPTTHIPVITRVYVYSQSATL